MWRIPLQLNHILRYIMNINLHLYLICNVLSAFFSLSVTEHKVSLSTPECDGLCTCRENTLSCATSGTRLWTVHLSNSAINQRPSQHISNIFPRCNSNIYYSPSLCTPLDLTKILSISVIVWLSMFLLSTKPQTLKDLIKPLLFFVHFFISLTTLRSSQMVTFEVCLLQ